jgi:hypothetical protein
VITSKRRETKNSAYYNYHLQFIDAPQTEVVVDPIAVDPIAAVAPVAVAARSSQ